MTRIYKGYITLKDRQLLFDNGFSLSILHKYNFCACGNVAEYLTYLICDENGDYLQEYATIQFIRVKSNGKYFFVVNSIN